jgi:pimeloyl-ACP methyl ester carboxylesterase
LISGGPSDRNCENFHHRPFLVVADYLTRNGIAVLRYDDRGVDGSTGDFFQSTNMDFSQDVISAFNYLCSRKEIDTNKIGLIGHSEGGVVAAIAASRKTHIGFIILLASPGINLKDDFELQEELKYKSGDLTEEGYEFRKRFFEQCYRFIENDINYDLARDSLLMFREEYKLLDSSLREEFKLLHSSQNILTDFKFKRLLYESLSPHNQFNIKCDPSDYLEKVRCPVLSLNGSKDIFVPAKINQDAIREALTKAENNNFRIVELAGLNHAFQECETGSIRESIDIEQTFSPTALKVIKNWITSLYK